MEVVERHSRETRQLRWQSMVSCDLQCVHGACLRCNPRIATVALSIERHVKPLAQIAVAPYRYHFVPAKIME
jgi:hypothetical protein